MLNQYDLSFDSLISNLPGYLLIKDLHSMYLAANTTLVSEYRLKKSDDVYGYTDTTIPHDLAEIGSFFLELDRQLIQEQKNMNGIYAFPFHGEVRSFQFNRFFLKNRDEENVAIFSHAIENKDKKNRRLINGLIAIDPIPHWQERKLTASCYFFNASYDQIQLTTIESCCLFYILRNKSRSDISYLLNLSVKKVDVLIDRIFQQAMVRSKAELIDVAIERNYFRIIPPGIVTHLSSLQEQPAKLINHYQENMFTKRELDCAKYLLNGMKHKEIALKLNISSRTVETHLNNLKIKLNCRDKIALTIRLKEISAFGE